MPPRFIKFHGFGNDYIVIESSQLASVQNLGDFARRICDRHYGAGGDGIAVVTPSSDADSDFGVRIFNPDSSEAGLSGNGTRCAAAYLYYQNLWSAEELRLKMRTGIKRYFLRERNDGKFIFDSELGNPLFENNSIPMLTEEPLDRVVGYPLVVAGKTIPVTAMQMGNPVCCIFVDSFDELDWRGIGPQIENHKRFPDRTNVVFIKVLDRKTIELRIWERGVGETSASGSCSCAAAVASMVNNKTDRLLTAETPGGKVKIQWRDDNEVVITGSAEVIYSGDWLATVQS